MRMLAPLAVAIVIVAIGFTAKSPFVTGSAINPTALQCQFLAHRIRFTSIIEA